MMACLSLEARRAFSSFSAPTLSAPELTARTGRKGPGAFGEPGEVGGEVATASLSATASAGAAEGAAFGDGAPGLESSWGEDAADLVVFFKEEGLRTKNCSGRQPSRRTAIRTSPCALLMMSRACLSVAIGVPLTAVMMSIAWRRPEADARLPGLTSWTRGWATSPENTQSPSPSLDAAVSLCSTTTSSSSATSSSSGWGGAGRGGVGSEASSLASSSSSEPLSAPRPRIGHASSTRAVSATLGLATSASGALATFATWALAATWLRNPFSAMNLLTASSAGVGESDSSYIVGWMTSSPAISTSPLSAMRAAFSCALLQHPQQGSSQFC